MSGRGPKKERVKSKYGRHSGWESADDADAQSERFSRILPKKGKAGGRQQKQAPGRAERIAAQAKIMEKPQRTFRLVGADLSAGSPEVWKAATPEAAAKKAWRNNKHLVRVELAEVGGGPDNGRTYVFDTNGFNLAKVGLQQQAQRASGGRCADRQLRKMEWAMDGDADDDGGGGAGKRGGGGMDEDW